jgi:hypothetical protein
MTTSNFYSVGLSHVGAYQVSGIPYITGSTLPSVSDSSLRFEFPTVTKSLIVRTNDTVDVRVHFAPYTASFGYTDGAATDGNYIVLSGSGQVELDVKCKEVFISSPSATTETVEIYAELTNIPASRMFDLDGLEGVS